MAACVPGEGASYRPGAMGPLEAKGMLGWPEPGEPTPTDLRRERVGICIAGVGYIPGLAGPFPTLGSTAFSLFSNSWLL